MEQELKAYLDEKFAPLERKLERICERQTLGATEERIVARLEQFETSLTAAFRDLGTPADVRFPCVSDMLNGFYERRALAEQRISELERKRAS